MIDPKIRTLLRDNRQIRLHILFVLWASPNPATIAEIAADLNVNRDTISDWLPAMETDGYVCHFGAGRWNKWSVTDKYRQLPLPNLIGDAEKTRITSSSSDLISPDGLRSEISEEEDDAEESTPPERAAIADDYRLTGEYRTIVLSDPWITRRRFERWFEHASDAKKRNPAAYAVQCCAHHDEPPEERDEIADNWEREIQRRKFARDLERYRSRPDAK